MNSVKLARFPPWVWLHLCYARVMDGGSNIEALETALRLSHQRPDEDEAFEAALRALGEQWGSPLLAAPEDELSGLIEEFLDSPEYCRDYNRYVYLLHEAHRSFPPGSEHLARLDELRNPTLEVMMGPKAFQLWGRVLDATQRYFAVLRHIPGVDFGRIMTDLTGPIQTQRTVVDFIQDSSIPPEGLRILYHAVESNLCEVALAHFFMTSQPTPQSRLKALLQKIYIGMDERARLTASAHPTQVPASLVSVEERYPLAYWQRKHEQYREGVRMMHGEMHRLGLARYVPHEVRDEDEEE